MQFSRKLKVNAFRQALFTTFILLTFIIPSEGKGATLGTSDPMKHGDLVGHVVDKATHEYLPGITIYLKGTPKGAMTDASGHYFLRNLNPGHYTVVMQSVGYKTQEKEIVIEKGASLEVNFEAEEDVLSLDEVVVSSNRQRTLRKLAPTLVSVLDDRIFEIANAVSLSQGLTFQPGLRVENNCQNCGFSQVRINGLDGRYSQILIDSRPSFSALAGIYGLEQIPANMIDRVEVVRGGGSALYGSNAIAGVINVITKEPEYNSFRFRENLTLIDGRVPDNTISFSGTIVGSDGRIGGMIFGQNRVRQPWDANGDGFSELGMNKNNSFGGRLYFRPTTQDRLSVETHFIQEYRRGGDHFDLPDQYASVSERLEHNVYSGNANYSHRSEDGTGLLQIYGSGQVVLRDSYYGGVGDENLGSLGHLPSVVEEGNYVPGINFGKTTGQTYVAGIQWNKDFGHLLFMPAKLLLGTEYSYDGLNDIMPVRRWIPDPSGKETLYPPVSQHLHIVSQIAQFEWTNDSWTILLGGRLDEHSMVRGKGGNIKPVFSPRATLRYNPLSNISLRATYAKGFRAPQLFDEDLHVNVVGGESQRIQNHPGLTPEDSHSFSLSADTYFTLGEVQTNLLVEGFYTRLLDAFTTNEIGAKDGYIIYERINGSGAKVAGINIEAKAALHHLVLQGGLTIQTSKWDEAQEWGIRSRLSGEDAKSPRELNTLTENGPEKLAGFARDAEGDYEDVSMTTQHFLRTPNIYGYLTVQYNPIRPLTLSTTLNYTGKMYAPHVIEYGRQSALMDRDLVKSGKRESTGTDDAPRWDRLEHTPQFVELGAKASYDFKIFNTSVLQVYLGANNLFNSIQKDFDLNGARDSAYVYGPSQPRSYYLGISMDF